MEHMISTDTRTERIAPQQLTLLSEHESEQLMPSKAHGRFQLSKATRERGLSHVAEIRAQLAHAQARRDAEQRLTLPRRTSQAA